MSEPVKFEANGGKAVYGLTQVPPTVCVGGQPVLSYPGGHSSWHSRHRHVLVKPGQQTTATAHHGVCVSKDALRARMLSEHASRDIARDNDHSGGSSPGGKTLRPKTMSSFPAPKQKLFKASVGVSVVVS